MRRQPNCESPVGPASDRISATHVSAAPYVINTPMPRLAAAATLLAACLSSGCPRVPSSAPTSRFVTEHDARLISIARQALLSEGRVLTDRIYQVRPFEDGWIVQADYAPGYDGVGEPSVVLDATSFVKINARGEATEISGYRWRIDLTTRPSREVRPP
jgi:hypothetical protein